MMFTPCCPRAGPIGGAGLAAPALIWSLIRPVTFFLGAISSSFHRTDAVASLLPRTRHLRAAVACAHANAHTNHTSLPDPRHLRIPRETPQRPKSLGRFEVELISSFW